MKKLGMLGIIGGAAILTAVPLSLQWSQRNVTLSLDGAEARIGRPLTATSIAGVNRRVHRRAYRPSVYPGAGAAGVGANGHWAYYRLYPPRPPPPPPSPPYSPPPLPS